MRWEAPPPPTPTASLLPSPFSLPVRDGEAEAGALQRDPGTCHRLRPRPCQQRHKVCKGRRTAWVLSAPAGAGGPPRPRPHPFGPCLPTRVAFGARALLGPQLAVVAVTAVLWVPRIFEGQAWRRLLQVAALCAWGCKRRSGFSRQPRSRSKPPSTWWCSGPCGRSHPYPGGRSGSNVLAAGGAARRPRLGTRA